MNNRAIGIMAHVDAGKTTLAEALLYVCKKIEKPGRVDHGDSVLDSDPLERQRGITLFSGLAELNINGVPVTLIDTPGHEDLTAEAERTLQILDYAILVIDATAGIQRQTRRLWNMLKKYRLPVIVFINKTDLPGAMNRNITGELEDEFGYGFVPFWKENAADLNELFDDSGFCEQLALSDETLLEKFTKGEKLTISDIQKAHTERRIFPCFKGSALKLEGIDFFTKTLSELIKHEKHYGENEAFYARVFKIAPDNQGKRQCFVRVLSGSLKVRDKTDYGKITQIRIYNGGAFNPADEVKAGQVCALMGLSGLKTGDILGMGIPAKDSRSGPFPLRADDIVATGIWYGVGLPEGCNVRSAIDNFMLLSEEMPDLCIFWNDTVDELQLQIAGDVQRELLLELIKERYGLDVSFQEPRFPEPEFPFETEDGYFDEDGIFHEYEEEESIEEEPKKKKEISEEDELMAIFERTYGPIKSGHHDTPVSIKAPKEYVYKEKKQKLKKDHLVVDGYNIIFAWQELGEIAGVSGSVSSESGREITPDSLAAARDKLTDMLSDYAGYTGRQITLVFDAYKRGNYEGELLHINNIDVVYTRENQTADQYIEKLADEIGKKQLVTVATSDGTEQVIIRAKGCLSMSARELRQELRRVLEAPEYTFPAEPRSATTSLRQYLEGVLPDSE